MARTVLIPPREHCWVASDAYDRSAFAELSAATPTLAELAARGGALVPCFRELLEDFFCLLFKLDPRLRAADEVAPAAAFNRALLATLDGHPALAALRAETQLDEAQAGLGALLLGTRVLEALRAGRRPTRPASPRRGCGRRRRTWPSASARCRGAPARCSQRPRPRSPPSSPTSPGRRAPGARASAPAGGSRPRARSSSAGGL